MIFIVTLLVLLIERFFHWHYLRNWQWFRHYERWLSQHIGQWPMAVTALFAIIVPVMAVGLIEYLLSGWAFGIFKLIFSAIVLLYCLGPVNLWVQVYQSIQSFNEEDAQSIQTVQTVFGVELALSTPQTLQQALIRAIIIAAHQRLFAMIFWFAILGPMGAVFYRLIEFFSHPNELRTKGITLSIKQVLDWLSVRVFAFIFALSGHFTRVFYFWKENVFKPVQENETLLGDCGLAALDLSNEVLTPRAAAQETLALLDRSFMIWLVALAVLVLIF